MRDGQAPPRTVNDSTKFFSLSRLTVGGYGEAVYTRNFYSDNMFRYSHADRDAVVKFIDAI